MKKLNWNDLYDLRLMDNGYGLPVSRALLYCNRCRREHYHRLISFVRSVSALYICDFCERNGYDVDVQRI